ncbi:MAG: hypothetical protein QXG75_05665 [Candidatus Caldarchaeum sp.]
MKLSSPPTRWALTSVVAAAMKYGPTRVSRIAYELDMPVETCRYYLKRFYKAGFRFLPVVDYRALGLSPHVAFIRFSKQIDGKKRENFLRWLDSVYVVYRASLNQEREYMLEVVPPEGDGKTYERILSFLQDAGVFENYQLHNIVDGYYQPMWLAMYDFTREGWADKIEGVDVPKIPLSVNKGTVKFDKTDLLILKELEKEPTVKMNTISQRYDVAPQLLSYHREKHVEGSRLITGFIPIGRNIQQSTKMTLLHYTTDNFETDLFEDYLHSIRQANKCLLLRLHTPFSIIIQQNYPRFEISPSSVLLFTIPSEHYLQNEWTHLRVFEEQLEKLTKLA